MERRGLDLPLLIGGATTSKQHTAVQDRAGVLARRRARPRRLARHRRGLGPARQRRRASASTARTASCRSGCATQHAEKERKPLLPFADARANPQRLDFGDLPVPSFTGTPRGRARPRDDAPLHRLAVLLPRLGAEGEVPRDPRAARRARALRRRARRLLDEIVATRCLPAAWRVRLLAGALRRRRRRARGRARDSTSCASRARTGTRARTVARRLRGARAATTSARSRSRSTAPTSSPPATRPSTTTTTRSSSRRSRTGSPRRSPSICTAVAARVVRAGRAAAERGPDRGAVPRDPAGLRLPRVPRPLGEADALRRCSAPRRSASSSRRVRDASGSRVSGIYLAHPDARYFSVGRVGRDQAEDYAARKGIPLEQVERWLAPNLASTPRPEPALS